MAFGMKRILRYNSRMHITKKLNFKPLFGLASKHLQMILSAYIPHGKAPPSHQWLVDLGKGDQLSCEVSIPPILQLPQKTIVLIHGLGGSHDSRYMIRNSRNFYNKGYKVVRINLRGSGSGKGLSKLPYNAGNSEDLLKVLQALKNEETESEIYVIGFSLGGNTALKLAGELGTEAEKMVKTFIAVCPPFDLEHTVHAIQKKRHYLYHKYYLGNISKQISPWTKQKFHSLLDLDNTLTGPIWGYKDAKEYYQKCSSKYYLANISTTTHLISAEDDPFVSLESLNDVSISSHVNLWTTQHGSHMGFLGRTDKGGTLQWIDHILQDFIQEV